ncbi:MAG TPA: L-histidine N(alpha)-methyltransferase [Nitrososphaera sp.]|jgi:dimethylhistidine N-methyltransferase
MTAQRTRNQEDLDAREFELDVLAGLASAEKFLHFKYFYDDLGSDLFDQICRQPEYYPTRTEAAILRQFAPRIAELTEADEVSIVELGSGSGAKTKILIREMVASKDRVYYFPIDISQKSLSENSAMLRSEFPEIEVVEIARDYVHGIREVNTIISANEEATPQAKLFLFLGSSIGNFEPRQVVSFLRTVRENMQPGDLFLVGFDLHKEKRILDAAYNDKNGITARFNLNLLERINAELQGQFDLSKFTHIAYYNEPMRRIEMHLLSKEDQQVYVGALGRHFRFRKGESIHTENSYKFEPDQIKELANESGFSVKEYFTDSEKWFGLALLSPHS